MWWIYPVYVVILVALVYLSMKLGDLVDEMDKKTKISGAFIGGVLLAAVTSLPELFTSISSVLIVKNPALVIGDILGSDIFDLAALLILTLIWFKNFHTAKLDKFHIISLIVLLGLYGLTAYAVFAPAKWQLMLGGINAISIVILIGYILYLIFQPKQASEEKEESKSKLSLKAIIILFIVVSILIIGASIGITYMTDMIGDQLPWLSGSVGGAILLGVATSIPEIISTFQLFHKKNYDAGFGNMIGSCVFNFFIIGLADLFSWPAISGDTLVDRGIYVRSPNSMLLVIFGACTAAITLLFIVIKNFTKLIKGKGSSLTFSSIFAALGTAFYLLPFFLW